MNHTDSDLDQEAAWNRRSGAPGRPLNSSAHDSSQGQEAFRAGEPRKSPHLAGGGRDKHWLAGWDAAAQMAAHDQDRWDRNLEDTQRGRW